MWPRSHTSGLMIGECTRSSWLVVELAPPAPACARAPPSIAEQRLLGVGGEWVGLVPRGLPWLAVLRHSRTIVPRAGYALQARCELAGSRAPLHLPRVVACSDAGVVPARDDRGARARSRARRSRPSRGPGARRSRAPSAIQRAPSTRSMCPCENTAASPSAARARAITRSARAPTSPALSPPGQPSRHSTQSGRASWICARRQPLVVAVVPLEQVLAHAAHRRQPAQLARFARAHARGSRARARKLHARSAAASALAAVASGVGERDVGAAGVPAVEAPLRLRVAHEHDSVRRAARLGRPRRAAIRGTVAAAHAGGAAGAAASSAITVRRSRRSRLAGTWRLGSASIAATASALLAPVASSTQLARRAQHRQAQRDPLGRRLGRVAHTQAQRVLARVERGRARETARRRARRGRSRARRRRAPAATDRSRCARQAARELLA